SIFSTLPRSRSTIFPYTTLFRSSAKDRGVRGGGRGNRRESLIVAIEGAGTLRTDATQYKVGDLCLHPGAFQLVAEVLIDGDEGRSEEHTSELQSRENLVCRLLLE